AMALRRKWTPRRQGQRTRSPSEQPKVRAENEPEYSSRQVPKVTKCKTHTPIRMYWMVRRRNPRGARIGWHGSRACTRSASAGRSPAPKQQQEERCIERYREQPEE